MFNPKMHKIGARLSGLLPILGGARIIKLCSFLKKNWAQDEAEEGNKRRGYALCALQISYIPFKKSLFILYPKPKVIYMFMKIDSR